MRATAVSGNMFPRFARALEHVNIEKRSRTDASELCYKGSQSVRFVTYTGARADERVVKNRKKTMNEGYCQKRLSVLKYVLTL